MLLLITTILVKKQYGNNFYPAFKAWGAINWVIHPWVPLVICHLTLPSLEISLFWSLCEIVSHQGEGCKEENIS